MMDEKISIWILGFVFSALFGILGYFIKKTMEKIEKKIDTLDEKMDFQITKQNEYDYRIKELEKKHDIHDQKITLNTEKILLLETKHKLNHGE